MRRFPRSNHIKPHKPTVHTQHPPSPSSIYPSCWLNLTWLSFAKWLTNVVTRRCCERRPLKLGFWGEQASDTMNWSDFTLLQGLSLLANVEHDKLSYSSWRGCWKLWATTSGHRGWSVIKREKALNALMHKRQTFWHIIATLASKPISSASLSKIEIEVFCRLK